LNPTGGASLDGEAVSGVLFDYGNTLVTFDRPEAALAAAYVRIAARLRAVGLEPPEPEILLRDVHDRVEAELAAHMRGASLEEIDLVDAARRAYADLGLQTDAAVLDEVLRLEQEAWWVGVAVDPQAIPTLDELRRRGVRVGLCSNAPYRVRSLHDQLTHFGLDAHLDSITFSGEIGWRKPSQRIFEAALVALGEPAQRTVMFGDSIADDVAGAHAAGMRAVLLRRDSRSIADETQTGATIAVNELGEIVPLLFEYRRL